MTRIFGHYIPVEMMLLWLFELTLCFIIGTALMDTGVGTGVLGADITGSAAAGVGAALAVSACLTSFAIGLYRPETFLRLRRLLAKTAVAAVLSFPAFWVIGHLTGLQFGMLLGQGPLLPAKLLVGWIATVVGLRLAFSYSLRMHLFTRRVIILGAGPEAQRTADAIDHLRNGLFEVAGTMRSLDDTGSDEGLREIAGRILEQLRRRRIWGVVVAGSGPAAERAGIALNHPKGSGRGSGRLGGVRIWNDQDFWESQLRRVDIAHIGPAAAAEIRAASGSHRSEAFVRRATDIALSLILLSFTLPLMLLTALAIRLDSPGPVFYRQERLGLHGMPFVLCKFRSMRTDAEATGPVWAAKSDSRVTRIGAFIRRSRIDELPQLMNVLRGEMSFIGPRPERPHFVEKLAAQIPFYAERAQVKPGLTGWAQVSYPYGASVEDARMKLSYDLYYVKHHSLFLDVLILFATVRVILFQEGAR